MAAGSDVFISYKSDDAEVVRDVAECLRANRVNCWFAEYSLSLEEWLSANDAVIDQTLKAAVVAARHVIVFASPGWHGSQWCTDEHARALEQLGVDRISIVRLSPSEFDTLFIRPPHAIYDFDDENLPRLCQFLSKRLGRTISLPKGPSPLGRTALLTRGPFAADLACAPLQKLDYIFLCGLIGRVCGHSVRCTFAFHPLRTTGIAWGVDRERLVQRAALRTNLGSPEKQPPDRIIYREYAQRAADSSQASGVHVFGLHLLSNRSGDATGIESGWDGLSAFAISKVQPAGNGLFVVGRDYCLRLNNGPQGPVGELMLLFETDAKCATMGEAQLQLSQIAPYLDRVACSVRYHGKTVPFVRRRAFAATVAYYSLVLVGLLVIVRWLGIAQPYSLSEFIHALIALGIFRLLHRGLLEYLTRHFLWPTVRITVINR